MSYANNREIQLYWEEHGRGEPLLLITGLGTTLEGWRRLLPRVSEKYRVIVFDNRGVGRSSDPPVSFSMLDMAEDAKAVMEAAGLESAHVLGASMGGMIAQELALNYPEKLRSLTLAVTSCGGGEGIQSKPRVLQTLQSTGALSARDAFWVMAPFVYDASTPRFVLEEDLERRLKIRLKPQNFIAQLQAILFWRGSFTRLDQIKVPTLVLHGVNDQLIVCENGRKLAQNILSAKYVELENASHMFIADQPIKSTEAILSFLDSVK